MKIFNILLAAALLAAPLQGRAADPKDILGKIGSAISGSNSGSQEESSDKGSDGGILGALGGLINNVAANTKFSVDDLVGTWNYTGPAVSFESANALQKIGGAGAATVVENKLAPYYTKLGFDKAVLTVDKDHNFTMKLGVLTLNGVVEKEGEQLVFSFNAFKKIPLGKVKANATKSGKQLNVTFDATKFVNMLTKISSKLNISTLNSIGSLLNSYDGIYIGFKFKG